MCVGVERVGGAFTFLCIYKSLQYVVVSKERGSLCLTAFDKT